MNIIRLAYILLSVPVLVNLFVSIFLFAAGTTPEFTGYLGGAAAGAMMAYYWFWEIIKASSSGPIKLFKILGAGFLIKLVIMVAVLAIGTRFTSFNRMYFAAAFLFSVMSASVVEIWYFVSISRLGKK